MNLHEAYRDFENLPQLRPDEKESPFAKFYYVPVEMPAPEILEGIDADKPMDPAKADDLDRYFNTELDRLQTDHVDYYLMHMLSDMGTWENQQINRKSSVWHDDTFIR